ncbi:hypothetical protein [Saccharopolyspora sp. 5N708]|uniref:hypothetical protein n=1 Tax=Saccharopolyspora sp. 5N708 TaxID=3457424 RepID=UPI003FD16218
MSNKINMSRGVRPYISGRRFATMRIWEILTGGDVRLHPGDLAPRDPQGRTAYADFLANEARQLTDYLAEEAERQLLRHRIDEQVTWQPESTGPRGPWGSPKPDLTRRLPGWVSPSRRTTLRLAARDHTIYGWQQIIINRAFSLNQTATYLRSFDDETAFFWSGNAMNWMSLHHTGRESYGLRHLRMVQEHLKEPLLKADGGGYTITPTGRHVLAELMRSIEPEITGENRIDVWDSITDLVAPNPVRMVPLAARACLAAIIAETNRASVI